MRGRPCASASTSPSLRRTGQEVHRGHLQRRATSANRCSHTSTAVTAREGLGGAAKCGHAGANTAPITTSCANPPSPTSRFAEETRILIRAPTRVDRRRCSLAPCAKRRVRFSVGMHMTDAIRIRHARHQRVAGAAHSGRRSPRPHTRRRRDRYAQSVWHTRRAAGRRFAAKPCRKPVALVPGVTRPAV
jgi:hypothetical protein